MQINCDFVTMVGDERC